MRSLQIHKDGKTSRMNQEMIKTAWIHKNNGSGKNEQRTILQGGFKNPKGETEAMSAYCFAKTRYPFSELSFVLEKKSFRTHNNALEGLDIISKKIPENRSYISCRSSNTHGKSSSLL